MIDRAVLLMIADLKATTKTNEKKAIIADYYNKFSSDGLDLFLKLTLSSNKLFFKKSLSEVIATPTMTQPTTVELLRKLDETDDRAEILSILQIAKGVTNYNTQVIFEIVLSKDMDCGVGATLVNGALGIKLIPVFEVAKAEEQKYLKTEDEPKYINLKIDGQRMIFIANRDGESVAMTSSGNIIKQLGMIQQHLLEHANDYFEQNKNILSVQMDGELLGVDEQGKEIKRSTSNGIANRMVNNNAGKEIDCMRFWQFDLIGRTHSKLSYEESATPLNVRVSELEALFTTQSAKQRYSIIPVDYTLCETLSEIKTHFAAVVKSGREGIIVKDYNSPYQIKRQKHWVKLKREVEIDVVVTGHSEHKKRHDMIGALTIESSCGRIKGSIGTGISEEDRIALKVMAENETLNGSIITIVVHEITSNKKNDNLSFYLPRVTELRTDKFIADDYEKIMNMF
ncbi:putative DNA ligase [Alishewanella phage vB_AspM_Slickus01]|nr:putative DNA ligase [Alishewanella phage vB_AspM_Slickus01]